MEMAESVDHARPQKLCHVRALFLREASISHVIFRPRQIDLFVGNIKVPANYDRLFFLKSFQIFQDSRVKFPLEFQPR
jgi:hypothetical protein